MSFTGQPGCGLATEDGVREVWCGQSRAAAHSNESSCESKGKRERPSNSSKKLASIRLLSTSESPAVATEESLVVTGPIVTWNSTCVRYHIALGRKVGRPYISSGNVASCLRRFSSRLPPGSEACTKTTA